MNCLNFEKEIQELKHWVKNLEKKLFEMMEEIKKIRTMLEEEREKRIFRGMKERKTELPWPYQKALSYIKKAKRNINARSLAEALEISRSRASEILNELHRMGYLEKQRKKRMVIFKYTEEENISQT